MADRPNRERKMNLPAIERGGRWFTKYDPNIALDIVERIAEGELLSKITAKNAEPQTITKQTFLRWVATVPELAKAYAGALQLSAHSFEEMAIDKAQQVALAPGTQQNVSAASLLISQYRWSAARRNPTKYSDKGNTQIVVPVQINTTLDMGNKSGTIDVEVPDIYSLKIEDAEFSEVTDDPQPLDVDASMEKLAAAKEQFRELLRPDEPVVGTQKQPILEAQKGKPGRPSGPRKRVLTPRVKK